MVSPVWWLTSFAFVRLMRQFGKFGEKDGIDGFEVEAALSLTSSCESVRHAISKRSIDVERNQVVCHIAFFGRYSPEPTRLSSLWINPNCSENELTRFVTGHSLVCGRIKHDLAKLRVDRVEWLHRQAPSLPRTGLDRREPSREPKSHPSASAATAANANHKG